MVKVSVVIPVHNTEKYLKQCIESVMSQTLKEIEVILVNNGSSDRSPEIIEEYRIQYPEVIKVVNSDIADLSSARNLGLLHAAGEYIAYLDSDDYVDTAIYEKLYIKAKQGNFDIVVCDMFYSYTKRNIRVSSGIHNDIYDRDSIRSSITAVHPAAWNKLFRRQLIEGDIKFKGFTYFEDFEFLYRLYPSVKSIGTVKEALIYYRQREGSIMHVFDERLYSFVKNFDSILAYHHKSGYFQEYAKELEYLFVRYAFATMIKRMSQMGNHKEFYAGYNFARKSVKNTFPGYRRNPLFYNMGAKGIYLIVFNRIVAELVYAFGAVSRLKRCA